MKKDTALLVIDVQAGMFMFPETDPVYAEDTLLQRVRLLIDKARTSHTPIFFVQHNEGPGAPLETNTPGWEIHTFITPESGDIIIQKHTPDSFHETNLQDELVARGVTKLVLAGLQTDYCIDATSRRAHQLGYETIVAEDAHSTYDQGNVTAAQIINQYNEQFSTFAKTQSSADIVF
jgi:nicotinamidase-related amidase